MKLNKKYIEALIKKYEYDISSAEAGLELYLSKDNLSAIGEHSDLIEEQLKFIEKITDAEDQLERFRKFLSNYDY